MAEFQVDRSEFGVVYLKGALTLVNARAVDDQVQQLLAERQGWLVDFSAVVHSDSSVLALMLSWVRQSRERNTSLQFLGLPPAVLAMAELSGIHALLPLQDAA